MSIGLKSKDILYIGRDLKNIIFNLMLKEKEKVESWLKKQADDLRIKDILLATYMTKRIDYTDFITIDEELKTEQVEKKIKDIYGKIKRVDKIRLFIDQARKYFTPGRDSYKICIFIEDILKRETRVNFNCNFREDYVKIMYSWHPNRKYFSTEYMFLKSNHIGLYLYYEILKKWVGEVIDIKYNLNDKKEFNLYSVSRDEITGNLYIHTINDIEIKIDTYLNKIERNNFPYEEIKYELINELIKVIKNDYDKVLEYLGEGNNRIKMRKVILYNIDLFIDKLRNSRLLDLLGIYNKSQCMII